MGYTKHNFKSGDKLTAVAMNEIEQGIVDNETAIANNKIQSVELYDQDEQGGNIYLVTLADGTTFTFTAPKGEKGDPGEDGADGGSGGDSSFELPEGVEISTRKITLSILDDYDPEVGAYDTLQLTPSGMIVSDADLQQGADFTASFDVNSGIELVGIGSGMYQDIVRLDSTKFHFENTFGSVDISLPNEPDENVYAGTLTIPIETGTLATQEWVTANPPEATYPDGFEPSTAKLNLFTYDVDMQANETEMVITPEGIDARVSNYVDAYTVSEIKLNGSKICICEASDVNTSKNLTIDHDGIHVAQYTIDTQFVGTFTYPTDGGTLATQEWVTAQLNALKAELQG